MLKTAQRLLQFCLIALSCGSFACAELRIDSISPDGRVQINGLFTNGVCTVERAAGIAGPWGAAKNTFSTNAKAELSMSFTNSVSFYRALAVDLSNGREGFTNLVESYNLLTTIAGAGGSTAAFNKWQPEFEGGPATNALLSRPHIAMADGAGNIYIADKDAHAVRKVTPEGAIHTVAGVNAPGNGADQEIYGPEVALWEPNGLWVKRDGTVYILDLVNGKIRRLGTNGACQTLFTVPGGIVAGRGLWVAEDESRAYVASGTVVKRWIADEGVTDFATGFVELGNLAIDPLGKLVVTDRFGHRVYRIEADGSKTVIAGTSTFGGGDGEFATETFLNEVRGVWFMPNGGYLLCTHRGSQVWYVDTAGYIHLLLNGSASFDTHAGDGTWFYNPAEFRVSECRAITMDLDGNILITDHDSGYIRKIQFLRHGPNPADD